MPIETKCPACHAKLRVPDSALGKQLRCPNCQTVSPVRAQQLEHPEKPDVSDQAKPDLFGSLPSSSQPQSYPPPQSSVYSEPPIDQNQSDDIFSTLDSVSNQPPNQGYSSPGYPSYGQDSNPYQAAPHYNPGEYSVPIEQRIRDRVHVCAITWIVFAAINSLFIGMGFFGPMIDLVEGRGLQVELLFLLAFLFLSLVGLGGAICMSKQRYHLLSLIGTLCTMVTGIFCCLIPTGIGLWAFIVLVLPGTRDHFLNNGRGRGGGSQW